MAQKFSACTLEPQGSHKLEKDPDALKKDP